MATIKSYTDLEQSKKLAEILPLESADMCYKCLGEDPYDIVMRPYTDWKEEYKGLLISGDANVFPCWSLTALLGVLPESYQLTSNKEGKVQLMLIHHLEKDYYDNPVDACYELIVKLHELKML